MTRLYTDPALGLVVEYVPRSEWGSSPRTETFIKNRAKTVPVQKTELHAHHTAAIDTSDDTPNEWGFEDAVRYMRRLETARPDLGPLPYSENIAVSEDGSTVWIFEGRGLNVIGAHTGSHNTAGIGVGVLGNLDIDPGSHVLSLIVRTIELRARDLRHRLGFINLGKIRNPKGWEVWGHRDTAAKSCPGSILYPRLESIRFVNEEEIPVSAPLAPYEVAAIAEMEATKIFSKYTTDEPGEVDRPVTIRTLAVLFSRMIDVIEATTAQAAGGQKMTRAEILSIVRTALED